jgi:hypothetical protein
MSSWGTRQDWGQWGMVVGQPIDRFALDYWPQAYRESLRLAVVGCSGGVDVRGRQNGSGWAVLQGVQGSCVCVAFRSGRAAGWDV